jgi:predicted O-methyltransferase YrrM
MSTRYLFGPVSLAFAEDNLAAPRAAGECLPFDFQPGADLAVSPEDTWESFQSRFPAGWQPDFIALYLPYRTIPACLWSAPVPLVGLAGDCNLLWHCYREQLPRCELVLADTESAERLGRDGCANVRAFNMYGAPDSFAREWPETTRDIDILFVGNFNSAVQGERLPWLGRVARNEGRGKRGEGRVVLATEVRGEAYRKLLGRARIVFNRGIRGEWNMRVTEALAGGALLFQEASNREVPLFLKDREECVLYTDENLNELLGYYLEHEDERVEIAAAGRRRLPEFTFATLWGRAVEEIGASLADLRERAGRRPAWEAAVNLPARTWQALNNELPLDAALIEDIRQALEVEPRSAALENMLGLVVAWRAGQGDGLAGAAAAFQRAWTADPRYVLAGLNLAEVLAVMGQKAEAVEQARRTLAMLERLESGRRGRTDCESVLDAARAGTDSQSVLQAAGTGTDCKSVLRQAGHYPSHFDEFRVGWERAGWENAGRPEEEERAKRELIHWRLHLLLGQQTGDLVHLAEAALARPESPVSQAALGMALGHNRRWAEAACHLRLALERQPFAMDVARALWEVLKHQGEQAAQERLARDYRLLHRCAPGIVLAESWMQTGAPAELPLKTAQVISAEKFQRSYRAVEAGRALHGFTPPRDTQVVLALLAQARPQRILEIGTAAGHMTANLTEWSPDDAQVFSLGITADMAATRNAQAPEAPPPQAFGAQKDHFGKGHKVTLIAADSLHFDFQQIAPIDFAFIDGAHDFKHVLSDSLGVYAILSPGGIIVWHDFNSPTPWVEVRQALEQTPFAEAIEHVEGTEVAFLRKALAEGIGESNTRGEGATGAMLSRVTGNDSGAAADTAKACGQASDTGEACFRGVVASSLDVANHPRKHGTHARSALHTLRIVWEGGFGALHSLALINREVCRRLAERGA